MMFESNSRYSAVETAEYETLDGRKLTYLRRRFLPQGESLQTLVEVTVADGDTLDLITARTLGDPEQSWRVCDANNALNPFDLTKESGSALRIPVPQIEEAR
jgi:hypothetical protein